ncbi:MAG: alkaline phosphatase family protein [Acidobacteria bacterium]|nr:alkaline phosphatase family protein [Acidobacteriota bacterium]
MNTQVVIVGLDAATFSLINQYIGEGLLPNIQKMISEGSSGLLLSTPNMHSASSWTSIITGKNPGKHGIYVFSDRTFATNKQAIFTGADRKCDSMFRILTNAGYRVGMMNIPMTYPAENAPGSFMISGLDAPVFDEKAFSSPSLRAEVLAKYPDYSPTPTNLAKHMEVQDLDGAIDLWLKLSYMHTEVAKDLIKRYSPDVFMIVYTATDWVQHYFWKYIEPRHPEYDAKEAVLYRDTIKRFYSVMDEIIGQLREIVGNQANTIIVSDHGMGPNTQGSFHVVDWLMGTGFMAMQAEEAFASVASAPSKTQEKAQELKNSVQQVVKNFLPSSVRSTIKNMIGEKAAPIANKDRFYSRVIWEQTRAYSEPGRNIININLKGRNKFGIVEPADYNKTCDEVIAKIKEWLDPDTGLPVVKEVKKRSEMYKGPYIEFASDMYVHWNSDVILQKATPEIIRKKKFWWNGTHRPQGIIICDGPKIEPNTTLEGACVYDIVPTVLNLVGVSAPVDLDGQILADAVIGMASNKPSNIKIGSDNDNNNSSGFTETSTDLSDDEESNVAEKLRSLGYL